MTYGGGISPPLVEEARLTMKLQVFGRSVNPHNPAYTPGGSSGGESALIAFGGSRIGVGMFPLYYAVCSLSHHVSIMGLQVRMLLAPFVSLLITPECIQYAVPVDGFPGPKTLLPSQARRE